MGLCCWPSCAGPQGVTFYAPRYQAPLTAVSRGSNQGVACFLGAGTSPPSSGVSIKSGRFCGVWVAVPHREEHMGAGLEKSCLDVLAMLEHILQLGCFALPPPGLFLQTGGFFLRAATLPQLTEPPQASFLSPWPWRRRSSET